MNKIERLMAIILVLNKNKRMTASDLARKFEVDIRTIYRDIQALSEMNVPIVSQVGPDGGYSVLSKFFIPPIMFNKEEIFSLLLSKKSIDEVSIPGYSKNIESAFLKIESVMDEDNTKEFNQIKKRILFEKTSRNTIKKEYDYFEMIKKSLELNLKIKIKAFLSSDMINTEMIIQPYGILYVDDDWLVISYCESVGQVESLPIFLISDAQLINETFTVPDDFDIDEYYCKKHCIMKCLNKDTQTVKLKVNKESYYRIKDYIFFHRAEVIEEENHYLLNMQAGDPGCYIQLAFRFKDFIEILEPQWLREEILRNLKNLINKYERY
ncbi:YafY family transcriptional regulator [Mycoplasmatota bacterium]|nr:YafY family transcriptional regulator [Mycoplasmatota bacterium]